MKLVVGLGNPGRKYEGTRHNIGFAVLDELVQRNWAAGAKSNFQGEVTETQIRSHKTLLLWPHTFMNLSGASVLAARDFYKLDEREILVVCDDFNLPLAKLRFRADGTAGGQKGLADVIDRLSTDGVPRLRIGVGPVPPNWEGADFALGRFSRDEQKTVDELVPRAAEAVEDWIDQGIDVCMNKYNA